MEIDSVLQNMYCIKRCVQMSIITGKLINILKNIVIQYDVPASTVECNKMPFLLNIKTFFKNLKKLPLCRKI